MTPATGPESGHDHDDLAWRAFRYVAGELDAEASAAFERRLDADQSAREAVAEAVLMAGAVARASAANRRQRRRRVALAALAVSCLVLTGAPRLLAPSGPVGDAPAAGPGAAVALAWSGLRQEGEAGNGPDAPRDDLIAWLAETPAAAEPAEAVDPLPPWLLEAAALPAPDDTRGL
jgi:hypothetical protein